jgi:hypothetical protein
VDFVGVIPLHVTLMIIILKNDNYIEKIGINLSY